VIAVEETLVRMAGKHLIGWLLPGTADQSQLDKLHEKNKKTY